MIGVCELHRIGSGYSQEDVEESVTMLDIEAALQEATVEAMADVTNQVQDLDSFQSSLL